MPVRNLWIGTFHSLCGRILRHEAKKCNLTPDFTIYDRDDSQRIVKDVIDELGLDKALYVPKKVIEQISRFKDSLITPSDSAPPYTDICLMDIYSGYQRALVKNNAVDFDDMLLNLILVFKSYTESKRRWAESFRYILVDEFQDTNSVQYELVRMLSSFHGNLTVVGDDDQSIYGWRGAKIHNILTFPKDFPGAVVVRLEQNYRSTSHILDTANQVVKNNTNRHPKKLWTDLGDGEKVVLNEYNSDRDEVDSITSDIKKHISKGVLPGSIAVLYRANQNFKTF